MCDVPSAGALRGVPARPELGAGLAEAGAGVGATPRCRSPAGPVLLGEAFGPKEACLGCRVALAAPGKRLPDAWTPFPCRSLQLQSRELRHSAIAAPCLGAGRVVGGLLASRSKCSLVASQPIGSRRPLHAVWPGGPPGCLPGRRGGNGQEQVQDGGDQVHVHIRILGLLFRTLLSLG